MAITSVGRQSLSVDDYYASDSIRARVREYCGGSTTTMPTAAYVVSLNAADNDMPTWDAARRVPASQIDSVWDRRSDLARSLWDSENLLFIFELDDENVDTPAEPFLHPANVFLKIESAYHAAAVVLRDLGLPAQAIMTGRGYHFAGLVPQDDPLVDELAALVPETPGWYSGVDARRPIGVTTPLTARQARAATGLGLLIEYLAHLIQERARESPIPVVFNGTVVGVVGGSGRECVSIDFSHVGDPLDVRHVRVAFSTYQWHRLRPDIFGAAAAIAEPTAALPRGRRSLMAMLRQGRGLAAARDAALRTTSVALPDVTPGISRLLAAYQHSALCAFHRRFHTERQALTASGARREVGDLPPCVGAALRWPNDLLLKPEHIQHVVRWLMGQGWSAAEIAVLVQSKYDEHHGWGDRWTARMDSRTRADFDVRVFAGLIETQADSLVDFNCVSTQEKALCPHVGCRYNLLTDRGRLAHGTT